MKGAADVGTGVELDLEAAASVRTYLESAPGIGTGLEHAVGVAALTQSEAEMGVVWVACRDPLIGGFWAAGMRLFTGTVLVTGCET